MFAKTRTGQSFNGDYTMDPAEFPLNDNDTSTIGNNDAGPIANYFQLFDKALVQHTIDIQITSSRMLDSTKTLFLKDLLVIGDFFNDSLFEFFIWVFSDPQKESFLSKVCNIKLIHFHSKKELLKVFINPDSRCLVNHGHKLWVSRCLKGWKNVCMQEGNLKEQHIAEIMISDLENGLNFEVDEIHNMGSIRTDNNSMYEYENYHPMNYEIENMHPRGYTPSYQMDFDDNVTMRPSHDYTMYDPRRSMSFANDRSDFPPSYNSRPPSVMQRSYSGLEFQKSVGDSDASKDIELLNLRRELAFRQSQLSSGSNPLKDMTNLREETNEQRKLEAALRDMMEYYDKALQNKDSQLDSLQKELMEKDQKFTNEIKTQQESLEEARLFYVRDLENGKLFNDYQIKLKKELETMKETYEKEAADKVLQLNERELYYENLIQQLKSDFSSKSALRDAELKEKELAFEDNVQRMVTELCNKEAQRESEYKEREIAKENNIKQLIIDAMSGAPGSLDFDDMPENDSSLFNFIQNFKSSIDYEISLKSQEVEIFERKERNYRSLLVEKDNETQTLLVQKENEFRNILSVAENVLKSSLAQKESEYKKKISEKVSNLETLLSQRERDFKKIFSDKVTSLENKIIEQESYFKSLLSGKETIIGEKDKEVKRLSIQISRADKEQEREIANKIEEYTFEMNRLINENKDVQASYSCVIAIEKERVNLISKLEEELERKRNQISPLSPTKGIEDDEKSVIKIMEKKLHVKSMEYSELLQKLTAFQNQKTFFMSELEKVKKGKESEYTKLRRELSQKEDKISELIAGKAKGVDSTNGQKELEIQVQMDAVKEQKRQLEKELRDVKMELSMKEFSKESSKKISDVKDSLEESSSKIKDVAYEHLHKDIDIIVKYEHEQALYIQELEQSVATYQVEYNNVESELETFKIKYFQLVDSITNLRSLDCLQIAKPQYIADPVVAQTVIEEKVDIAFSEVAVESNNITTSDDFSEQIDQSLPTNPQEIEEYIKKEEKPDSPKKQTFDTSYDSVINIPKTIRSPDEGSNNSWIKNLNPSNPSLADIDTTETETDSNITTNITVLTHLDIDEKNHEAFLPVVEIIPIIESNNIVITEEILTPLYLNDDDSVRSDLQIRKETANLKSDTEFFSPSESRNNLSGQPTNTTLISPLNSANYHSTSFDSLCISEVSDESLLVNKDIVESYKSKYLALQIEVPKPLSFTLERKVSNETLKNPLNSPPSAKLKFRNAEVLKAKTLFQDKISESNTLISTNISDSSQSPKPKDYSYDNIRSSSGKNIDDKLPSKVSVLKISMAKSSQELSKLFGISSTEVFDGEMMKKKFTSDFVFKDNFLWISAQTRSLHWVEDESEKANPKISKYLLLDKNDVSKKLQGEMMGVVKTVVELNNGRIVVTTDSGEKLELKMSSDNSASMWTKVIKMMT